MLENYRNKYEQGYIAVLTLILLLIILGTGLAYLKWSADESVEFKHQYAAQQAYYIAQSAIARDAIPELADIQGVPPALIMRDGSADDLDLDLSPGMEGNWSWTGRLSPKKSSQSGLGGIYTGVTNFYNVEVIATVTYGDFNRYDEQEEIKVDTTMFLQYHSSESWAQYLYFTNYEVTQFGEQIKFFNGDTLWWEVYSNDQIAIMQSPVFYANVYSTAENFWQGPGYNPQFENNSQPYFNCDTIPFYETLEDLRNAAGAQGHFYSNSGQDQFRCTFMGSQGLKISKWPLGLPFMDSIIYSGPPPTDGAFFVDGRLEVLGTDPLFHNDMGVQGRLSVGCSGDMWLLDNVRYVNSDARTGAIDSSSSDLLGLQSESNVLIANTFENGRDNGGNIAPNDPWRSDIIINAGIVALDESFSFEDQNDIISAYQGQLPEWYYSEGPNPDERGQIHLWGQVSQYRRGYVHRSNHGGTGYLKDYHYDYRFYFDPPPYYPKIAGSFGASKSIEGWGAGTVPEETYEEPQQP